MSATFDRAYELADSAVRQRMSAKRLNKPEAIEEVAREAGLSPGTLQNLFKRRLKHVERIIFPLQRLSFRDLEKRAAKLARDIEQARASSLSFDRDGMAEVQAQADDALRRMAQLLGE
jgi:AraC-like DNA-binding protein